MPAPLAAALSLTLSDVHLLGKIMDAADGDLLEEAGLVLTGPEMDHAAGLFGRLDRYLTGYFGADWDTKEVL